MLSRAVQKHARRQQDTKGRKRDINSECPIVVKQKTNKRLSAYQRFLNAQLQSV